MEIIAAGKQKSAMIVSVRGRMDVLSAPEFEKKIEEYHLSGENVFIIDFSDLVFISSAGLRSILIAAKKLEVRGGRLILAGAKDAVQKVLTISGFNALIPMHDSVETALEQF